MLDLFDQGTPVPIRRFLARHTVRTAAQEGWDRVTNGELILRAEAARFDVLLTTDKILNISKIFESGKLQLSLSAIRNGLN